MDHHAAPREDIRWTWIWGLGINSHRENGGKTLRMEGPPLAVESPLLEPFKRGRMGPNAPLQKVYMGLNIKGIIWYGTTIFHIKNLGKHYAKPQTLVNWNPKLSYPR